MVSILEARAAKLGLALQSRLLPSKSGLVPATHIPAGDLFEFTGGTSAAHKESLCDDEIRCTLLEV